LPVADAHVPAESVFAPDAASRFPRRAVLARPGVLRLTPDDVGFARSHNAALEPIDVVTF
jgi:hypothetical protein